MSELFNVPSWEPKRCDIVSALFRCSSCYVLSRWIGPIEAPCGGINVILYDPLGAPLLSLSDDNNSAAGLPTWVLGMYDVYAVFQTQVHVMGRWATS